MTVEQTPEAGGVDRRRLAVHSALLAFVLCLGLFVVDPMSSYSADEGAVITQVEVLHDDGTWVRPFPVPELDPAGRWFPLEFPALTEDGGAPYVKHPVYPLSMQPFYALAGVPGMVVGSILGTVLAAAGAALLAARVRTAMVIPTLWLVGVGSPLFFDAYLIIAHSLAAAAVAWGVLAALRAVDAEHVVWCTAVAVALLGLAELWRTEAIFVGPALAVALATWTAGPRLARRLVVGGACTAASVGAYLLDGRLAQWVLDETGTDLFVIGGHGSVLVARVNGFVNTWLLPGDEASTPGSALLLGVPVVLLVLSFAVRSGRADSRRVGMLAAIAVFLVVSGAVLAPSTGIPGLLVAFPLLVLAIPWTWDLLRDGTHRVLLVTAAVFALGVLATQYELGGTTEWGGRYFALGLPLVSPAVVDVVQRMVARVGRPAAPALLAAVVAIPLVVAVVALSALRTVHARTDSIVTGVVDAAAELSDHERPVLVAVNGLVPRLAWSQLDQARWLLVPPEELPDLFAAASATDLDEILIVTSGDLDGYIATPQGYDATGSVAVGGAWRVTRLAPTAD